MLFTRNCQIIPGHFCQVRIFICMQLWSNKNVRKCSKIKWKLEKGNFGSGQKARVLTPLQLKCTMCHTLTGLWVGFFTARNHVREHHTKYLVGSNPEGLGGKGVWPYAMDRVTMLTLIANLTMPVRTTRSIIYCSMASLQLATNFDSQHPFKIRGSCRWCHRRELPYVSQHHGIGVV